MWNGTKDYFGVCQKETNTTRQDGDEQVLCGTVNFLRVCQGRRNKKRQTKRVMTKVLSGRINYFGAFARDKKDELVGMHSSLRVEPNIQGSQKKTHPGKLLSNNEK